MISSSGSTSSFASTLGSVAAELKVRMRMLMAVVIARPEIKLVL
jgi:hypothetical protein